MEVFHSSRRPNYHVSLTANPPSKENFFSTNTRHRDSPVSPTVTGITITSCAQGVKWPRLGKRNISLPHCFTYSKGQLTPAVFQIPHIKVDFRRRVDNDRCSLFPSFNSRIINAGCAIRFLRRIAFSGAS